MTTAIKEAIIKKLPAEGVRRKAEEEGVRSMRADGIRKVLAGITTLGLLFDRMRLVDFLDRIDPELLERIRIWNAAGAVVAANVIN